MTQQSCWRLVTRNILYFYALHYVVFIDLSTMTHTLTDGILFYVLFYFIFHLSLISLSQDVDTYMPTIFHFPTFFAIEQVPYLFLITYKLHCHSLRNNRQDMQHLQRKFEDLSVEILLEIFVMIAYPS